MAIEHVLSAQRPAKLRAKRHTGVKFSPAEYDRLSELLRISQQTLLDASATLSKVHPDSPMVERLHLEAETAADLRERIEAR